MCVPSLFVQSEPQRVQEALLALLPSINTDVTVNHCAWVTPEGRTIKKNDCYLITGCDGLHPTFSKVLEILMVADIVLLQVLNCTVQYFDNHYHAYVIEHSVVKSYMNFTELTDRSVLHAHKKNNLL